MQLIHDLLKKLNWIELIFIFSFFQGKMIMQDKLEKERNDAKNSVEEYVYDMRDKLHGLYEKFISESVSTLSSPQYSNMQCALWLPWCCQFRMI